MNQETIAVMSETMPMRNARLARVGLNAGSADAIPELAYQTAKPTTAKAVSRIAVAKYVLFVSYAPPNHHLIVSRDWTARQLRSEPLMA